MIASLRRRHRFMFVGLVMVGAPLLALSLVGRGSETPGDLPEDLLPRAEATAPTTQPFSDLKADFQPGPDTWVLELHEPLTQPDVLAYWSPTAPAGSGLPDKAYLLGPVSAARANLYLPPAAARSGNAGHLILVSLGHQELVTSGALTTQGGAP